MSEACTSDRESLTPLTPAQRQCDEDTGHDWNHVAYEPDTNAGGYMECKLCGYTTSDDGFDAGSDFDDNVI